MLQVGHRPAQALRSGRLEFSLDQVHHRRLNERTRKRERDILFVIGFSILCLLDALLFYLASVVPDRMCVCILFFFFNEMQEEACLIRDAGGQKVGRTV